MKNIILFIILGLSLSSYAEVDTSKLEQSVRAIPGSDLKINITGYTAYSVCDIGTIFERYNCRNEFANNSYTDKRLHVAQLSSDKLSGEAAACFDRQAAELIKVAKVLKKEKRRDLKLNFLFHVVKEDNARTLKKNLLDKSAQDPSVKTCSGEGECIEASFWAENGRCRINYADDLIASLCTNH